MAAPANSPDTRTELLADLYELILSWSEPPAASDEPAGREEAPQKEKET
jgi:hypothetical protein